MTPIRYRDPDPTDPAEIATVAAIGAETFVTTFGQLYTPLDLAAFIADNHSPAAAHRFLTDPKNIFRLVEDAQGCCGYAMLSPNGLPHVPADARAIEIKRFYLLPRLHGRGVADALMDWCVATARSSRHTLLTLSVFSDNHRALRFYARHGFTEAGRYVFLVGEQQDDERVYVRPL